MHLELPSEMIQCPGRRSPSCTALRRKGIPFLRDLRRIQLIITPSRDEEKVEGSKDRKSRPRYRF